MGTFIGSFLTANAINGSRLKELEEKVNVLEGFKDGLLTRS
jgi:hypothetical protein